MGDASVSQLPLTSVLGLCSAFLSARVVLVLDQFEEFFRYQATRDDYGNTLAELADALTSTALTATFVLSMREDHALDLSTLGSLVPSLFANFYRLERLTPQQAREALEGPLAIVGGSYQNGLVDQILADIADPEQVAELTTLLASQQGRPCIDPPLIQIVCEQLWSIAGKRTDRNILVSDYKIRGRAAGLVPSFFRSKMTAFGFMEKRILSRVFDMLVVPGAKLAMPLRLLAKRSGASERRLAPILNHLQRVWVLRMHVVYRASTSDDALQTGREEDQDEYFELYHDLFVKEIGRWNTDFKMALFGLQVLAWGLAAVASAVAYVGYRNAVRHHLEIGPRDEITVYRGDLGIPDVFSQRAFVKETSLRKGDLAPIHQEAKPVDFRRPHQRARGLGGGAEGNWRPARVGRAGQGADNCGQHDRWIGRRSSSRSRLKGSPCPVSRTPLVGSFHNALAGMPGAFFSSPRSGTLEPPTPRARSRPTWTTRARR